MNSSIRVLLADDHTLVAEAIRGFLSDYVDCIGVVSSGLALVIETVRLRPDVILTDIAMPGLNGIDAIQRLRQQGIDTPAIILTMHGDTFLAVAAMRAGASGYVVKHADTAELLSAIREVAAGGTYITPLIARDVVAALVDGPAGAPASLKLTPRKTEILKLTAEGLSMKQIAATLRISRRTAESHKYELMRMLGVRNTAELIRYAMLLGLVSIAPSTEARPGRDTPGRPTAALA